MTVNQSPILERTYNPPRIPSPRSRRLIVVVSRIILILPSAEAGIWMPLAEAIARNPVTAISRPMMTTAIQAGTACVPTRQMRAEATSSLSAVGSSSWPRMVVCFFLRAQSPSSVSVSVARRKMAKATR
jgi:hypothetical protein